MLLSLGSAAVGVINTNPTQQEIDIPLNPEVSPATTKTIQAPRVRLNLLDFIPVIRNLRELKRAKRAKSLEPDMFYVPRGELVLQLKDSLGNLLEERREKITISSIVAWEKLTADFVAKEEGEVTVFIDNSDTEPVYFDNLELRIESDPTLVITQEHHYYPFGMNLSGIERQGDLMYQFNGMVEKEQAFGLELYETPFRSYDAQLGRFWQVEPLADEFHSISMFQFGFNNPISANDPSGLRTIYTLTGPEKVRGLAEFIYDRNANEYSYDDWTGQYKDGNGNVASWGKVSNFLQTTYGADMTIISKSLMQKVLGLMGEGTISNLSISYKAQGEEVARITYDFEATGGKQSRVAAIITDERRGEFDNSPFYPRIEEGVGISKSGTLDAVMGIATGGLQIVGGVALAIGTEGLATPLAVALIYDGAIRIGLNSTRLYQYTVQRDKAKADAFPTNTGALIGKEIDKARGVPQNATGSFQIGFGLGNDMFSFVAGGGNAGALTSILSPALARKTVSHRSFLTSDFYVFGL